MFGSIASPGHNLHSMNDSSGEVLHVENEGLALQVGMAGQRCLQRETLSSLVVLTTVELCLTREGTLAVGPVRAPALGQAGQDRQLWATKGM